MTALLVLLSGCARPQGIQAAPTLLPSPMPVAAHDALTVANPTFHAGEIGVAYAPVTLSATGGVTPYHWTVSVGSLPGGLDLSADGIISGTPTANGNYAFSVQVFDADSDTAGVPASIPIAPRLMASLVSACALECSVELGCVSVCGTFGQVSGGAAPFTYSLTGGVLPSGTTLSGLALNGKFTGLPGRLQFTVRVTDGFGSTATIAPRYSLLPHISVAPSATCGPIYYRMGCTIAVPYSGGTPSASPAVKVTGAGGTLCTRQVTGAITCGPSTSLPPGFTASAGGGSVSIDIPGGSQTYYTYLGTITFVLVDQNLCAAGTYCTSATSTVRVDLNGG